LSPDDDQVQAIRNACEDYTSTVHALLAFSALIVHDGTAVRPDARFGFGRRMTTSSRNQISPSTEVTPDLVAQKDERYGIASEIKRSLSKDSGHWDDHVNQLRKYDDDLAGWWTASEKIATSDSVLLIHHSRSRRFRNYLEDLVTKNPGEAGQSMALVEFVRSEEATVYIFFRQEWGKISDPDLGRRLHDEGVQVPLSDVLRTFSSVRFYDSAPPLHLLLTWLWTDIFAAMADPANYDERLRANPIPVSVEAITRELQEAYGSRAGPFTADVRSAEFPQRAWVRQALDTLVSIGLARSESGDAGYLVLYRSFREDVLTHFVELLENVAQKQQSDETSQLSLPFQRANENSS